MWFIPRVVIPRVGLFPGWVIPEVRNSAGKTKKPATESTFSQERRELTTPVSLLDEKELSTPVSLLGEKGLF